MKQTTAADPNAVPAAQPEPAAAPPRLVDLPAWLTVGFPLLVLAFMATAYFVHRPLYGYMIQKEGGLEYATVLVLLPGIVAGLLAFRLRHRLPIAWLRWWPLLCAAGLFYFAGEELSWGQWLFFWEAPEVMQEINRQEETNLHNISTIFGRKPKQVVEIWSVAACIVLPLLLRRRKPPLQPDRDWGYWFWPTMACVVPAALSALVYLPTRLIKAMSEDGEAPVMLRLSELQEFYFAVVLAIYVGSIYIRLRQMPAPDRQAARVTPG